MLSLITGSCIIESEELVMTMALTKNNVKSGQGDKIVQ